MKKFFNLLLVVFIISGFLFSSEVSPAAAESSVAEGSWNTGTEVKIDLVKYPGPTWMNLLTSGVKVNGPTKICHPFRGGQFHWVGQIMQLVDGKWKKVDTVNDWVPSQDGVFTSCAKVNRAGTYALFGYYDGPKETISNSSSGCSYNSSAWTVTSRWNEGDVEFFTDLSDDVPGSLGATFVVDVGHDNYEGPSSINGTTTQFEGDSYVSFFTSYASGSIWTITVTVTVGSCSKTTTVSNPPL